MQLKLEQTILSEVLGGNSEALSSLEPEHFQIEEHRVIARIIKNERRATYSDVRAAINSSTHFTHKRPLLDALSAVEEGLYAYIPEDFAELRDNHIIRCTKQRAMCISKLGTDECTLENARELVQEMQQLMMESAPEHALEYEDGLDEVVDMEEQDLKEKRLYLKHPLMVDFYDKYLMQRLYVISGFSSMGKNIFADNLVVDLIKNYRGVYYSFDNSAQETVMALTAIENGIPYRKIQDGALTDYEKKNVKSKKRAGGVTIVTKRMNIDQIRADLERRQREQPVRFFLLDYFTNLRIDGKDMVRQFEEAAVTIKTICGQLGLTAIVLSQLNDAGEVKWCRGLFQEAYHVCKLDGERGSEERVLSVEKWKKGALSSRKIKINGAIGLIGDLDAKQNYQPRPYRDPTGDNEERRGALFLNKEAIKELF